MDQVLIITFWTAGALLAYTFFGYPLAIHLLGKLRSAKAQPAPGGSVPQSVSIIMVVRNEAARIAARIENLLDTDFPADRIQIVVVSDGSSDGTAQQLDPAEFPCVHLIESDAHRGKAACINDGTDEATGEIIVFADARQSFTPTTIPALVGAFADPRVGAVSGELLIGESASGVAAGVDAYWRLEKAIRLGESRLDSSIGCTGAVYAIRRAAYTPLPDDTILDDVVCPMQVALGGQRVLFCPEAVAFDPQCLSPASEKRRKRRTLAGNFQMLFRYPGWLLPWRNRLVLQLVSHKYLRLAAPLLMLLVLGTSLILASHESAFFLCAAIAQGVFYVLAVVGIAIPSLRWKCFSLPAGFVFLNFMTLLGFIEYFKLRGKGGW